MKEHHVDGTSSLQVLKGLLRYRTRGQAHDLPTGSLITLAASIKHEVESVVESVFLLTISWPDSHQLLALQHRGYGT
jgi:quercetin dioxygenase-like cupin family protein